MTVGHQLNSSGVVSAVVVDFKLSQIWGLILAHIPAPQSQSTGYFDPSNGCNCVFKLSIVSEQVFGYQWEISRMCEHSWREVVCTTETGCNCSSTPPPLFFLSLWQTIHTWAIWRMNDYPQRVKESFGDVADVRSKALPGDLAPVQNLCKTSSSEHD